MFYFNVITRRFLELFILEVLLSAIFSALFHFQLLPSYLGIVTLVLIIELTVFIGLNTIMMRHCYIDLSNNFLYFILNFSANLIFGIVNLAFYFILNQKAYTWFFGIFKATSIIANTGIFFSAAVFHLIMLLMICAAPFGIKRLQEKNTNVRY